MGGQKKIQREKIKYNHKTSNRATDLTKTKPKNKIQLNNTTGKTQLYQTCPATATRKIRRTRNISHSQSLITL